MQHREQSLVNVERCVMSSRQRIASMASETQEYSSLDSTHGTEELYVQETTHNPEVDDDPLLQLLETQRESSPEAEQLTVPDRPSQNPGRKPENKELSGTRHLTIHHGYG